MEKWFFMRPGFDTFRLEPLAHKQFVFGKRDRYLRDSLLGSLQETCISREGHKAAVYGDYGMGKTHQSHNIIYEVLRRDLPLIPIYVKCAAWKAKEPFQNFFKELITRLKPEEVKRIAIAYEERVSAGRAESLANLIEFEEIAKVLKEGLTQPNIDKIKQCLKWLGGEAKADVSSVSDFLKPQLDDSREFGAVLRAFAHMYAQVERKILLFLVDESERFNNITNTDSFNTWLAAMREITEIVGVALVFHIGAKTKNELPVLFTMPEIMRRIGLPNYVELKNPGHEDLADFVNELLQTMIRKGEVPEEHRAVMDKGALSTEVPAELLEIVANDPERLKSYPFEPDALLGFVDDLSATGYASKPSEVLVRLQKYAQRAIRYNSKFITESIVREVNTEGF